MPEIAVIEHSRMDQATLAFQVRAVNVQLQQLAEAYDEEPWFCRSYATVPDADVVVMLLLDSIDEPGALGYHDLANGKPFGRCRVPNDPNNATTLSHECLELARDPGCNLWLPLPDGRRRIAYEVCDPVQNDEYPISITIGAETRTLWVSDFVLPAYWVEGAMGPFSYRDNVHEPFGVSRHGGGWRLVDDGQKVISEYGYIGATPGLVAAMTERARDPGSRTHRRGFRS